MRTASRTLAVVGVSHSATLLLVVCGGHGQHIPARLSRLDVAGGMPIAASWAGGHHRLACPCQTSLPTHRLAAARAHTDVAFQSANMPAGHGVQTPPLSAKLAAHTTTHVPDPRGCAKGCSCKAS
jgi:hypothetical protein